jgi:hypothetical protein
MHPFSVLLGLILHYCQGKSLKCGWLYGCKDAKAKEPERENASKDAHFPRQIALALSAVSARDEPNFNDSACLLRALIGRLAL